MDQILTLTGLATLRRDRHPSLWFAKEATCFKAANKQLRFCLWRVQSIMAMWIWWKKPWALCNITMQPQEQRNNMLQMTTLDFLTSESLNAKRRWHPITSNTVLDLTLISVFLMPKIKLLQFFIRNELKLGGANLPPVSYCQLNMSQCDASENNDQFVVNVYNSLARNINKYIRVPITNRILSYKVLDPQGNHNHSKNFRTILDSFFFFLNELLQVKKFPAKRYQSHLLFVRYLAERVVPLENSSS